MSGNRSRRLTITAILGIVVLGGILLSVPAPTMGRAFAPPTHSPSILGTPLPAATHGDLVVGPTNSPYVIQAQPSGGAYYEAGNITVLAGGTLWVKNTSVVFLEFIGTTGSAQNRLSHLYSVTINGRAVLWNSTVTTGTTILNAYVKLPVSVGAGGSLAVLSGSRLMFPGWLNINGVGASLFVNDSIIAANPRVPGLPDGSVILNDSGYAPTLNVTSGASAFFGGSATVQTYKNNPVSSGGAPGPVMTNSTLEALNAATPGHWTNFVLPAPTAQSMASAAAYPTVSYGSIVITYTTSSSTTSSVTFFNSGTTYALGTASFSPAGSTAVVALSALAIHQINTMGIPAFLQATGGFGGASGLFVNLSAPVSPVNVTSVTIRAFSSLPYNMMVSAATWTAVDSLFDLNFNNSSLPYAANRLMLATGSHAFLGNVSLTGPTSPGFGGQSAVIPDATSNATFYRWLAVPVEVAPLAPIAGAGTLAFYALDTSQTNNATTVWANALATTSPLLAAWVTKVDTSHGVTTYGTSDATGTARLLLAGTELSQINLPDGDFLGEYHIAVALAGAGIQWQFSGVSPYPTNMTPSTLDHARPAIYPGFVPNLKATVTSVAIGSVKVANKTVAIGQKLNISFNITNSGPAPTTSYSAQLQFLGPAGGLPVRVGAPASGIAVGAGATIASNLSWVVSETVTGLYGTFVGEFIISVTWDNGVAPSGGTSLTVQNVTILPAYIYISFTAQNLLLNATNAYAASATVTYAGSGSSEAWVNATGPGGPFPLGTSFQRPGTGAIQFVLAEQPGMGGGTYGVTITVAYNHRFTTATFANAFTVPGAPQQSPAQSFFNMKFFGYPLWELLIFVGIGVLVVIGVLAGAKVAARGQLVECGECGQLIPEKAQACPKCGAEFETDVVRCSRCGSTIPARSEMCPECAATLLGKEEAASRDPNRQGYADFTERYRIDARKELGDNYSESAFWDWWKRQQSYVSFSQYRLQQAQGSRAGMGAPPVISAQEEEAPPAARRGGSYSAPPARAPPAAPPPRRPPPSGPPAGAVAEPAGAAAAPGMRACPNCGKEVPPDFLVCPFCGAVTK